jgi:ADP-heptose:LPS heptosyltransferase
MNFLKKIEHVLKDILATILRAMLKQPEKALSPPYRRILFLRYDVLGDMILSIPVFRATRRRYPETEIGVLCSRKNYILLADTDLADDLYIFDKHPFKIYNLIRTLRGKKYDLIINLVTRPSFTFGIIARLAGPHAVRMAADQEQFSYFNNHLIKLPPKQDIHMLQRKFLVSAEIIGENVTDIEIPWVAYPQPIKQAARKLFYQIIANIGSSKDSARLVAVNLSAGLTRREWPIKKNVIFFTQLIEKYKDIIDGWAIFTNPVKPDEVESVVKQVDKPQLTIIPPQLDFRIIMELLPHFFALVTPDTSIAHAASAMGTPVLVMMIGENINIWDPIGVANVIVLSQDPYSLTELPVNNAVEGFDNLMSQLKV